MRDQRAVSEFLRTISPQYNIDVLLNGQNETAGDTSNDGLGILDQPATFVNSIVGEGGFLGGPTSPGPGAAVRKRFLSLL